MYQIIGFSWVLFQFPYHFLDEQILSKNRLPLLLSSYSIHYKYKGYIILCGGGGVLNIVPLSSIKNKKSFNHEGWLNIFQSFCTFW